MQFGRVFLVMPNGARQCITGQYRFVQAALQNGRKGDSERIIYANRISPEKGLHVLLDAFELVLARRPKATLDIIGPDNLIPLKTVTSLNDNPAVRQLEHFYASDYADQMRKRVRGGLEGKVSFVGPLLHSQLAARLRASGVLVQPSVFDEPFGSIRGFYCSETF